VADDDSTICASCKKKKDRIATFTDPQGQGATMAFSTSEEGYVKGTAIYMVMDDLEVKALCTSSLVTLLTQFNIKDIGDIEEKVVDLGMDEVWNSLFLAFCVFQLPNASFLSFFLCIIFL
jgi:hypothetical protein